MWRLNRFTSFRCSLLDLNLVASIRIYQSTPTLQGHTGYNRQQVFSKSGLYIYLPLLFNQLRLGRVVPSPSFIEHSLICFNIHQWSIESKIMSSVILSTISTRMLLGICSQSNQRGKRHLLFSNFSNDMQMPRLIDP